MVDTTQKDVTAGETTGSGTPSGADLLIRDKIKNMPVTLDNLVLILEEAYKTLAPISQANLILAIGSTGCGKSTMLTSLMFGPDALEMKESFKTIQVPLTGG